MTVFDEIIFPEMYCEVTTEMDYVRVLIILPDKKIGSTFPFYLDPYQKEITSTIPEGHFDLEVISNKEAVEFEMPEEVFQEMLDARNAVQNISFDQFETEWNQYLKEYQGYWKSLKKEYPEGSKVQGTVMCFVHVGVIVNINADKNIYGIISPESLNRLRKEHGFQWGSGTKLNVEVTGFDNVNMWLVIECDNVCIGGSQPFWPPPYIK